MLAVSRQAGIKILNQTAGTTQLTLQGFPQNTYSTKILIAVLSCPNIHSNFVIFGQGSTTRKLIHQIWNQHRSQHTNT